MSSRLSESWVVYIPSRAGHPPGGLDGASEDDELCAVDDRVTCDAADERSDEGLEGVHGEGGRIS